MSRKNQKDNAYDLRLIFEEMELELIKSMRRTLKRHEAEEIEEGFKWEQWQKAKLRSIREYRNENKKIIKEQSPGIKKLVEQVLDESYKQGRNRIKTLVSKLADRLKPSFPKGLSSRDLELPEPNEQDFFGLNKDKVEALQKEAEAGIQDTDKEDIEPMPEKPLESENKKSEPEPFKPEGKEKELEGSQDKKAKQLEKKVNKDLKNVQGAVLRNVDDMYRKTIYRAGMYMASGAKTLDQAIDMATKELLQKGINCIEYKDGKRVNIASYAEMALRTASQRATFLGEGKARDEIGVHTVIVSAHANTCPKCAMWQGTVLVDDVFSSGTLDEALEGGYYLLSFAIKAGLLHPNCRHTLSTFFPGISSIPQVPDEKQAIKRYQAEQEQRRLEQTIRKWKRISAGSMDKEVVKAANDKVRELQAELREHLDKHPYLRRSYRREKIYTEPPAGAASISKYSHGFNPDASYYVDIPGVSKEVCAIVAEKSRYVAEEGGKDGKERMLIIDKDTGTEVYYEVGEIGQVGGRDFFNKLVESQPDSIITIHNHADNGMFSLIDMNTNLEYPSIYAAIASCHNGKVFCVARHKNGETHSSMLIKAETIYRESIVEPLLTDSRNGKMNQAEYTRVKETSITRQLSIDYFDYFIEEDTGGK